MKKDVLSVRYFQKALLYWLFDIIYNPLASIYDTIALLVSRGLWKRWICQVFSYIEVKKVLEIGHGPGHLMSYLLQNNIAVTGIDLSQSMGRLAKNNILSSLKEKTLEPCTPPFESPSLIRAHCKSIPLPNDSFPLIVSTFPAPYIFQQKTLLELKRILTKNGKLIILVNATLDNSGLINRSIISLLILFGFVEASSFNLKPYLDTLQEAGYRETQTAVHRVDTSSVYIISGRK